MKAYWRRYKSMLRTRTVSNKFVTLYDHVLAFGPYLRFETALSLNSKAPNIIKVNKNGMIAAGSLIYSGLGDKICTESSNFYTKCIMHMTNIDSRRILICWIIIINSIYELYALNEIRVFMNYYTEKYIDLMSDNFNITDRKQQRICDIEQ